MTRRLAVTGATGYIGRRVVARAAGWEVITLGRRPLPGIAFRACELAKAFDPALLDGVDAIVHLAADTTGGDEVGAAELAFARALAEAASARGIRLVVASSQVAAPDAPSAYGRTKAAIEQALRPLGAVVVRPGLVYGGPPQGLFGMLVGACRRLPVLPDLWPRPRVQPVHVDDVADALLRAAAREDLRGRVLGVAGAPVGFGPFLALVARHRLGRRRLLLPVPVALLRALLSLASRLVGPALSPQRLDSLVRIPPMHCEDDLVTLGIVPRPLTEGLAAGGRHRALLGEGQRLAHAFLRRPVGGALLRRYVRALGALGVAQADARIARLPAIVLPAVDVPASRRIHGSAAWRVGVLMRLAEADRVLAPCFLVGRRAGLMRFALDVLRAGLLEVGARLLRPFAGPGRRA